MRLIDADRLLDRCIFYHLPNGRIAVPVIDVQHAPTVEPRPRGRWVSMSDIDGDYYCCSQCGEELPRYSLSTPTWDDPYTYLQSIDETNFCPNCGADMRQREEEQDGQN